MSLSYRSLELTPLDRIPPKYYTRLSLSFKTNTKPNTVILKLQNGLDQMCKHVPWIAGKVVPTTDNPRQKFGMQVAWCSNDTPKVTDLGTLPGSYETAAASFMPLNIVPENKWPTPGPIDKALHTSGAAVFAAGVLSFEAGDGVLVCVCLHHSVCDAGGMAEIISLWSRAMVGDLPTLATAEVEPPVDERATRLTVALGQHLQSASNQSTEMLLAKHLAYKTTPLYFPTGPTSCTSSILRLSLSKITTLKSKLAAHVSSPPATNTIICAVLWICLTRIRHKRNPSLFACPPQENDQCVLGIPVNGRARILPNFSTPTDAYLGNVYVYTTALLSAAEVLSTPILTTSQLAWICSAIAAAHSPQVIDAQHIAGLYALAERPEIAAGGLFPAWSITSGRDLAVTSWANLGLYELNFGPGLGGCPQFVRLPYTELDGAAIVLPRKDIVAPRSPKRQTNEEGIGVVGPRDEGGKEETGKDDADVIELMVMLRRDDLATLTADQAEDGWAMIAA